MGNKKLIEQQGGVFQVGALRGQEGANGAR